MLATALLALVSTVLALVAAEVVLRSMHSFGSDFELPLVTYGPGERILR